MMKLSFAKSLFSNNVEKFIVFSFFCIMESTYQTYRETGGHQCGISKKFPGLFESRFFAIVVTNSTSKNADNYVQ